MFDMTVFLEFQLTAQSKRNSNTLKKKVKVISQSDSSTVQLFFYNFFYKTVLFQYVYMITDLFDLANNIFVEAFCCLPHEFQTTEAFV